MTKEEQLYYDAGFLAGLKHARDWCKSSETYIQEEIDELEQQDEEYE